MTIQYSDYFAIKITLFSVPNSYFCVFGSHYKGWLFIKATLCWSTSWSY